MPGQKAEQARAERDPRDDFAYHGRLPKHPCDSPEESRDHDDHSDIEHHIGECGTHGKQCTIISLLRSKGP